MSLAVIAGATHSQGLMPRLEQQLKDAGIPFIVDDTPWQCRMGRSLGVFCAGLERLLDKTSEYEYLVLTDAWDVLFYGSKDGIIDALKGEFILFGSERNCWPDAYLAPCFKGKTPFRFMNTGNLAGKRSHIIEWLEAVTRHPAYHPEIIDQQWFGHRLLEGSPLAKIDEYTKIAYTMMMEGHRDIFVELKDGKLYNRVLNSHPQFIHFNGHAGDSLWHHVEEASAQGITAGIKDHFDGSPGPRQLEVVRFEYQSA